MEGLTILYLTIVGYLFCFLFYKYLRFFIANFYYKIVFLTICLYLSIGNTISYCGGGPSKIIVINPPARPDPSAFFPGVSSKAVQEGCAIVGTGVAIYALHRASRTISHKVKSPLNYDSFNTRSTYGLNNRGSMFHHHHGFGDSRLSSNFFDQELYLAAFRSQQYQPYNNTETKGFFINGTYFPVLSRSLPGHKQEHFLQDVSGIVSKN